MSVEHLKSLKSNLLDYQQQSCFTDISLVTSSGKVSAHKAILCPLLPQLKQIIPNDLVGEHLVIIIPSVSLETVQMALSNVYLENDVSQMAEILNIKHEENMDLSESSLSANEEKRNMGLSESSQSAVTKQKRKSRNVTTNHTPHIHTKGKLHFGKTHHTCEICGENFFKFSYLEKHKLRIHKIHSFKLKYRTKATGEKNPETFSTKTKWRNHMKTALGSQENLVSTDSFTSKEKSSGSNSGAQMMLSSVPVPVPAARDSQSSRRASY